MVQFLREGKGKIKAWTICSDSETFQNVSRILIFFENSRNFRKTIHSGLFNSLLSSLSILVCHAMHEVYQLFISWINDYNSECWCRCFAAKKKPLCAFNPFTLCLNERKWIARDDFHHYRLFYKNSCVFKICLQLKIPIEFYQSVVLIIINL